jgi:hypothetical protein
VSFSLHQDDFVPSVNLGEPHGDVLRQRGGYVLADEVGSDWQLAVSAVHQHCQLDAPRPAEVNKRVESRPDAATGVKDIVDQDDGPSFDVCWDITPLQIGSGLQMGQVVAVEADVERTDRHVRPFEFGDRARQALGQGHPARAHTDDDDTLDSAVSFDDFVCYTNDGAADLFAVEKDTAAGLVAMAIAGHQRPAEWQKKPARPAPGVRVNRQKGIRFSLPPSLERFKG